MYQDEVFIKSGGEFPYRRLFNGTTNNIPRLRYLIEDYTPIYNPDGYKESKIIGKVKTRTPSGVPSALDLFRKGPKNTPQKGTWEIDEVIDQYTETARMSSPGYGAIMSPLEAWFKTGLMGKLLNRVRSIPEAREAIYNEASLQEVRLAYVTDSISLYRYIREDLRGDLMVIPRPTVIDITAFGDRLVAAAAVGFNYIGVDPDPNLVDGISRLTQDVKAIKPDFRCETYTLPLEHFTPAHPVDVVTFSPPPFFAEPYTGGERQVHKVYRDFSHWFFGFIREALLRAYHWLRPGGILGFSVLDREGVPTRRTPDKSSPDKGSPAKGSPPQIYYTEAMIFLAASIGFKPEVIFTLSSSANTPWWIFRKEDYNSDLFNKYYSDHIPRLVFTNNTPAMEYIRLLATSYIVDTCINCNLFKVAPKKVSDIVARVIMSKIPNPDVDRDPLFPSLESEYIIPYGDLNDLSDVLFPIVIQTSDPGYRRVITRSEVITADNVLSMIFSIVVDYLNWIQCTVEFGDFSRTVKVKEGYLPNKTPILNLYVDHYNALSSISFLRKRTLYGHQKLESMIKVLRNFVVLWTSMGGNLKIASASSYLRYDAIGSIGHHYTRPKARIEVLAKIAGVDSSDQIVDLFATPFNANSKLYGSNYPDIDRGSLGNFFTWDGTSTSPGAIPGLGIAYMANPPAYEGFNEIMLERLMEVYLIPHPERIIFYATTIWEDDSQVYIDRIKNGKDPSYGSSGYYLLDTLWNRYRRYLRAVYILNDEKYPTYDQLTGKIVPKKRPTQSLGLVLASHEVTIPRIDSIRDLGPNHIFSI